MLRTLLNLSLPWNVEYLFPWGIRQIASNIANHKFFVENIRQVVIAIHMVSLRRPVNSSIFVTHLLPSFSDIYHSQS